MRYAQKTVVSVEHSRAEIEQVLRRYNADEFHSGWGRESAMIAFRMKALYIRFVLPIPAKDERRFHYRFNKRTRRDEKLSELQAERLREQEIRSRWRALLLVIKAKLEAVECGISSIEKEFLSFIVMPNDVTLGDWIIDNALPQIARGQMPLALTGPKANGDDVEDAEFTRKEKS